MSTDFVSGLPPKPDPKSTPISALPSILRSLRNQQVGVASRQLQRGSESERVDRVEISFSSRILADVQKITAEALNSLRMNTSADQRSHLASDKAESVEQVESNSDFSVDGTATLILRGITGYIFRAFTNQHPDMTEESLDKFLREASKGVDKGFTQARDYLVGMGQFDDSIKDEAEATIDQVHEGLRSFVDEQREALRQQG